MKPRTCTRGARRISLLPALVLLAALANEAQAQEQGPSLNWQPGPFSAPVGDGLARVEVPEGYVFLGEEDTGTLLQLMGNPLSGEELATLAPASDDENWFLIFEWSPMGWVDDSDKDDLDADAMMESIRQGTEAANEERRQNGWATMTIDGWHERPHYDAVTNNLVWAIDASSEGDKIINRLVKVLGRRGVMTVTLVSGPEELGTATAESDALLAGYAFEVGSTYAEFNPSTDDIAKAGLTALVVGGAGAALVKSGLLARFWKLIVFGVVALFAAVKRLFMGEERA